MLRSVGWHLVTDVSVQPVGPVIKVTSLPLKMGPIGWPKPCKLPINTARYIGRARNSFTPRRNSRKFGLYCTYFTKRIEALIWRCVYRASYCSLLVTNKMHNSYNQFLFHSFLSPLHVSNESSRSSLGARRNILYYTMCRRTNKMHKFWQIIFIFPMFLLAVHVSDELPVHHQEHCLLNCITHLVHLYCNIVSMS